MLIKIDFRIDVTTNLIFNIIYL